MDKRCRNCGFPVIAGYCECGPMGPTPAPLRAPRTKILSCGCTATDSGYGYVCNHTCADEIDRSRRLSDLIRRNRGKQS